MSRVPQRGRTRTLAGLAIFAQCAVGAPPVAAEATPDWIVPAARRVFAPSPATRGAVVLESDRRITLLPSGRQIERSRGAIRIDGSEGRDQAEARAIYRTDAGRVKQFRAWLVSPAGDVRPLPEKDVRDDAVAGGDLYNEVRVRWIRAGDLVPGMVFAWEWLVEQDEPFAQDEHRFQDELPVALARFALEVPEGWTVHASWANASGVEPVVTAGVWSWELRDLPEISDEPMRPVTRGLVPRLMVTAVPPEGLASKAPAFTDWSGVAGWLEHQIPPGNANEDLRLRQAAQRLVSGARSELDTLRAVARSVQQVRYVSIQMGIARGGGYRPRPASSVLDRGYGDCKDKANLMREMLAALGRDAWLVTLRLGEAREVAATWPSPLPFNHCILAIRLREPRGLPAEVAHPRLGPLLIFDPTDAFTPLGELSPHSEGGFALVVSPGTDPVVRLPEMPSGSSTVERRLELTLNAAGDAAGDLSERCRGASAAEERSQLAALDAREYRGLVVGWLRRAMPSVEVESLELHDDSLAARFETVVHFRIPGAAQSMQQRLLMLRPPLLARGGLALHSDRPRRHPVVIPGRAVTETLVVRIPEGFDVDEMPESRTLEGPLAWFRTDTRKEPGRVVQVRVLKEGRGTVPADRYAEIQAFYRKVRAAEDSPVVFVRR